MDCIKQKQRTFFDFFSIFNCEACENHLEDESIWIGSSAIHIYHLRLSCFHMENELLLWHSKLSQLLYESTLFQPVFILWLDTLEPLEQDGLIWEAFLETHQQIHIILME